MLLIIACVILLAAVWCCLSVFDSNQTLHWAACLQGGIYVVELIDKFTLAFPLLIIVMLELVVVSYFYGRAAHRIDIISFNL